MSRDLERRNLEARTPALFVPSRKCLVECRPRKIKEGGVLPRELHAGFPRVEKL